jgi:AraC family L-rhamnose operon regulatory protein RhaS
MAEQCGLKRSRFTTYCQQLTNRTPAQYLSSCRVNMAARMLREMPDSPVTEIAYACGFSSSQHFATTFRESNGVTPTQWRKKTAGSLRAITSPPPCTRAQGHFAKRI